MTFSNTLRAVGLAAVSVLLAQSASAYDWNECRGHKQVWNSNSVSFRPSSVSFPAGSAWRTAIESTRTAWNAAPGTNFDFTYSYNTSGSYNSGDGTNSILVTSNYGWGTGTLAVAIRRYKWCVWPFWGGKLDEVDVLFNAGRTWNTATNPAVPVSNVSISATLVGIHEMGHAFGLDHENDVMATMNSFYPNSGPLGADNDAVPHGDDVLGDRAGYGTSGAPRELYASAFRRTGAGTSDEIPAPTTMFRATSTSFQFTMGNRGAVNETSVGVKFYLSTDRTITSADFLVGSAGFSINQGVTVTKTANITANASVPAGSYFFGWIVDPENYIGEADEGNNSVALVGRTTLLDQTPPNACFTMTPTSGTVPVTIFLNASCSNDPDGTITRYTWNMGNGVSLLGSPASYTYQTSGFYTITLTVRDDDFLTDTAIKSINVSGGGGCLPTPNLGDDTGSHLEEPCDEPTPF